MKVEGHITKEIVVLEIEVKTRVTVIKLRDWKPGGMAYAELWKGMQVDTKVFDFYVRIITILEGPCQGDAFVLVQDLYRIALGAAYDASTIKKALRCQKEGVESIVGPDIIQMLKFSAYPSVSVRSNLMWIKFSTKFLVVLILVWCSQFVPILSPPQYWYKMETLVLKLTERKNMSEI